MACFLLRAAADGDEDGDEDVSEGAGDGGSHDDDRMDEESGSTARGGESGDL